MSEKIARHLVIVRHGESEGDVRRATRQNGNSYRPKIDSHKEEQTKKGHEQSLLAGKWILEFVMKPFGIKHFELCVNSPLVRTQQSAQSLGIGLEWHDEPLLTDRDRGKVQGLSPAEHQQKYPDSFEQMIENPLFWTPPEGQSILDVSQQVERFLEKITDSATVIAETHRDVMWAGHIPIDKLSLDEAAAVNTDHIVNAQVFHYTNVNPKDGSINGNIFRWKRSVCPWAEDNQITEKASYWTEISA